MVTILIVDDDPLISRTLKMHLTEKGYEVFLSSSGQEALEKLNRQQLDFILLDIRLPDLGGLEVLRQIKEKNPKASVVVMTAYDDMKTTVEAIKLGAFEYLVKPINFLELDLTLEKLKQIKSLETKVSYFIEERQKEYTIDNIVGHSPAMREVFKLIGSVANTRTNVLIQGESGTGKELVAKAIHYNSPWRTEPFIVINCSALSETLLESELFGHVRGAFTDAVSETKGKFEIAGKGTLFLDEVGDISLNLQSKLLRVIETRDYMKVGGEKILRAEARIIAATNQNLKALVEKGRFREDLYYRLKVVEINLPPLRERREDIPELVAYLLEKINRELRKNVRVVPPEVMKMLVEAPWRGNVRELENVLTRAVILARGEVILPEYIFLESEPQRIYSEELKPLREIEKEYIQHVLWKVNGHKLKASQILGISRPTLDKKIKEYNIVLPPET
ncbi:MAG: sigma-54 dependent transcriptional regulator [Candidatus Aminicenantes bacterium]|nr:sigma-54 dependent transcriptional regulator [Candidatus Aminicenantes bacterium]